MKKEDNPGTGSFFLSKWFLDYVGENSDAMIFYSAQLRWHGLSAYYTSWLRYTPSKGVILKSRFRDVQMPVQENGLITWADSKFGVSGTWTSRSPMIKDRIFDSADGQLDWYCYQPASDVELVVKDRILKGRGYAEQLILTAVPWDIPMDDLRWGRFGSDEHTMVWIELREKEKKQWLWLDDEKMANGIIEDDQISIPERNLILKLDRGVILESEKKIFSVVEKLIRFIPGFNRVMPLKFMMANEIKWLSNGHLFKEGQEIDRGTAIHESVSFRSV